MKGKISGFVKKLLEYLELVPLDIALEQTNYWLCGRDSLLFDTLSDDDIAGYAANFEKRLLSAARNGEDDFKGLFSYYIATGNVSAAGNLLNKIPFTAPDKCNIFLNALNRCDLTKIKLDSYADMVKLLAPFSNSLSSSRRFFRLLNEICKHRELPEIVNAGKVLLEIIYPIAEQSVDFRNNEQLLKAFAWLIDKSQFDKWFEKVFSSESRYRRRQQDRESDKLEVLLTYVEKGSSEPENWFQDAFDRISVLNREDEKKDRLIQLLRVAILKGTSAQAEKVLSCLSNATLSANAREFRDIDIFKLYEILNCGQVSDSAVRNIIYNQNWEDLSLEKLGILAPHLLEQEEYITTWFDALWKELASHKQTDAIMEIFQSCPEFGVFTSAATNTAVPETLTAQKLEKIYEGGLITCPNCSARVPNGKFCTECGSPLSKPVCPACGNEYQPGAKFCQECGTKL